MRRLPLPCIFVLLLASLSGCGNKGPLVLPDTPPAAASTIEQPTSPDSIH